MSSTTPPQPQPSITTLGRRGDWQRMKLWATAHAVDDLYQGLVPAAVPFFVLERDFSYVEASGLALAATFGSALPQPLFGVLADKYRLPWMSAVGIALAGIGVGAAGLAHSYVAVFGCLLLSGLGVAMFHPPAGRDARRAAGPSATAMSYFAAGGSLGFFLAPALATPALVQFGVGALALFVPPAVLMGFLLLRHHQRQAAAGARHHAAEGIDQPRLFATLTAVEIVRSIIAFGINTFVALYWIRHLGASPALGGLALTLALGGGVLGTLTGGRIADRIGMTRTVQLGNILLLPAFAGLLLCQDKYAALPIILLLGLATNIPAAVLVRLGQDYLPRRPGTAAGVTLGLAVSAGGLFQPVLGLIADHYGTQGVFITLACIPLISIALSQLLREPDSAITC